MICHTHTGRCHIFGRQYYMYNIPYLCFDFRVRWAAFCEALLHFMEYVCLAYIAV